MKVTFDEPAGFVRAGTASAPCAAAGADGAVRVGGALVRPVTFGERSVAAVTALRAPDPIPALCAALRARAVAEPASEPLDDALLDCVVLALAGSEEEQAPPFADVALAFARAVGGDFASVLGAPARELDLLWPALAGGDVTASGPAAPVADDGWTRALFIATGADVPAEAVRDDLAAVLLRRAAAPATSSAREAGAADAGPLPAPVPSSPPVARAPQAQDPQDALQPAASARAATGLAAAPTQATRSHTRLIAPHDLSSRERGMDDSPAPAAARRAGVHSAGRGSPRARVWAASGATAPRPGLDVSVPATASLAIAPLPEAAPAPPNPSGAPASPSPDPHGPAAWAANALRAAPAGAAAAPQPAAGEPVAAPWPARDRSPAVLEDLAEILAAALEEEADLRGVAR